MNQIEKYRKLSKWVQNIGMTLILIGGLFAVYFFGMRKQEDENSLFVTVIICMAMIVILFTFMLFVAVPLQNKLITTVILESLKDSVSNVEFNKKKGYNKESFEKLNLVNKPFEKYSCVDYYSFDYADMNIESCTVKAYDEHKIPKQKGVKGSKAKKKTELHFFGRIYIIPFESENKFNVFGKKTASVNRKKEMAKKEYCNELTFKAKKISDNFEVYYKDEKPTINMNDFMDKLLSLKIQSKGVISAFVRNKSLVLCVDNNRCYEEVDLKKPFDENILRGYKRDINVVLNFIKAITKED